MPEPTTREVQGECVNNKFTPRVSGQGDRAQRALTGAGQSALAPAICSPTSASTSPPRAKGACCTRYDAPEPVAGSYRRVGSRGAGGHARADELSPGAGEVRGRLPVLELLGGHRQRRGPLGSWILAGWEGPVPIHCRSSPDG